MYTDDQLVELGRSIIEARRLVWDLERKYKNKSTFYGEELKVARRVYRQLIALRKRVTSEAQLRLPL